MNFDVIKMRSIYLKEDEKGVAGMCAFSEELLAEGRAEGRAKGRAEGEARGEAKGVLQSVRNLMDSYKLTAQAAMDALKVSAQERPAILAAL